MLLKTRLCQVNPDGLVWNKLFLASLRRKQVPKKTNATISTKFSWPRRL